MQSLPFTISGPVLQGKHLGSKLGFPTANLNYQTQLQEWPENGVYAGFAIIDDDVARRYPCMLNQGHHPTAPEGAPTIEVHLLDYNGEPFYGHNLTVEYCMFLRPEQSFPSLQALCHQLTYDRDRTARWAQENQPDSAKEL